MYYHIDRNLQKLLLYWCVYYYNYVLSAFKWSVGSIVNEDIDHLAKILINTSANNKHSIDDTKTCDFS